MSDIIEQYRAKKNKNKSKAAFGTTSERKCFPHHVPPNRNGNALIAITGSPNLGPNVYDTDAHTNMIYEMEKKPCSTAGYTVGARKAKRFNSSLESATLPPNNYQKDWCKPKQFTQEYKPFGFGSPRSPLDESQDIPGPGSYEVATTGSGPRKVSWQGSFGSAPINLPGSQQGPAFGTESSIGCNTEKLASTSTEKRHLRRLAYLQLYF